MPMVQDPSTISMKSVSAKKRERVLGSEMAYVEEGSGDPIVLLHGNPTSSYLWRNVLPHLAPLGRCIVPDLIGMGDSAKLPDSGPGSYRFDVQRRHLDALLEQLGVRDRVVLVLHDWGSGLGFDWANRHRDAVRGIAYMEAIIRPPQSDNLPAEARELMSLLKSDEGERIALETPIYEEVLARGILRSLRDEELAEYRRPFRRPGEDRRPTLDWARANPLDGQPADVDAIVGDYCDWLAHSTVPKLFINGDPGMGLTGARRDFVRTWPVQREVTVPGLHFLQEDSPDEIGRAVAAWIATLP